MHDLDRALATASLPRHLLTGTWRSLGAVDAIPVCRWRTPLR
ncbi:hypothetical protein PV703_08490 [Streptomyces sp. ME01-24h]|nr:hypothetical protein [Streptomyces sp. ME01-24h]